jgi:benzoyl-CoA reductase/2-hydroxyglutaryl-CoA dehydratase subunit BcrC/BadD/HgdB
MSPTSIHLLRDLLSGCRSRLARPDRPVAWLSAFAPVELVEAAGLIAFYPESYAATAATRKAAPALLAASAAARDVCSYHRIFEAALDQGGYHHADPVPAPDLLVAAKNQCGTIPVWWRLLADRYQVPLVALDFPFIRADESAADAAAARRYVVDQLRALQALLQTRTAAAIDDDRLGAAVAAAAAACSSWRDLLDLRRRGIALDPRTAVDVMLPMVTMRCDPLTVPYYRRLREELAAGAGAPAPGRRVLWYGYPLWFMPRRFPELPAGLTLASESYTEWWALSYGEGDPLAAMADAYRRTFLNHDAPAKSRWLLQHVRERAIEGVVLVRNRSCKRDAADHEVQQRALKEARTPSVEIEADMIDRGCFDPGSVSLRLGTLAEMLGA